MGKKRAKPLPIPKNCARLSPVLRHVREVRLNLCPQGLERNDERVLKLFLSILQVLLCLVLVAVVMLQSGKSAGLSGAIAGGAETFLSKNKAKSVDAKLAKMTKWIAIAFMVLTLILSLV